MHNKTYNEILAVINQFDFILIDKKVYSLYPEVAQQLKGKNYYVIDNPEQEKNLRGFEKISNYLLECKISRRDKILAIGGGALSDLAGFVAATILRGVSWEVIPTTLLAMIDASVGGKVGVNNDFGKNLIGAFHKPLAIHLHCGFIDTLDPEEKKSGQGELLKYTFLQKKIYEEVLDNGYTDIIIALCTDYKNHIINIDLEENGPRKMLNFGHTFGHAIEKHLGIAHGVAVYFGIKMILEIYSPDLVCDFNKIVSKLNFDFANIPKMNFDKFCHYLSFDKKRNSNGDIEFIIPKTIGEMQIIPFSMDEIKKMLKNHELYNSYFE